MLRRYKVWWWENVVFSRKVLLLAISVFVFDDNVQTQSGLVILLLFFAATIHGLVQPFDTQELNSFELFSICTSEVVMVLGVVLSDGNASPSGKMAITILIVIIVSGFTAISALNIIRHLWVEKGVEITREIAHKVGIEMTVFKSRNPDPSSSRRSARVLERSVSMSTARSRKSSDANPGPDDVFSLPMDLDDSYANDSPVEIPETPSFDLEMAARVSAIAEELGELDILSGI